MFLSPFREHGIWQIWQTADLFKISGFKTCLCMLVCVKESN